MTPRKEELFPMSLTVAFNKKYKATKENDFVLTVSYGDQYNHYDFLTRVLTTSTTHSGVTALPFAQLDAESIDMFRAKLVELGGTPPSGNAKIDLGDKYIMKKEADAVLQVYGGGGLYYYDFAARIATAIGCGGMPPSASIVPFSQINRQALEAFRDKLVALKGAPPELPRIPATPAASAPGLG